MLTCQKHVSFTSVHQRTHSHPLGGGHSTFLLFNAKKHVVGHVTLGGECQKNSNLLDFLYRGP